MICAVIILGVVAAVVVLGALLAWAVTRREVPGVPAGVDTQSARGLGAGPVGPHDVRSLRFDQALRGYRMHQVDAALERLVEELAERDAEIDRLRGARPAAEHRATTAEGER